LIIKKLSDILAIKILNEVEEEEKISLDSLSRRISIILIHIFVFVVVSLVCLITDTLVETLLSIVAIVFIRLISGGNHFNSPDTCFYITTFAILIVPLTYVHVPIEVVDTLYPIVCISYFLVTPYDWSEVKEHWLKKVSMCLGVVLAFSISKIVFLVFCIMLIDQIVKNNIYEIKNANRWL